jgi:DNA polymerase-3 subunit beta
MKLQLQRDTLLKPLQQVAGVVERRQTLPILGHVLLDAQAEKLVLTATDLEVELVALQPAEVIEPGITTLPARKLLDIVRSLPESSELTLERGDARVELRSGSGRFTLSPLPAEDFPTLDDIEFESEFRISQRVLKQLLERTHFAMAQQDVRYYLNGLFIETDGHRINAVATDGHRLAVCELDDQEHDLSRIQVIVPRKGVQELLRLLEDTDSETVVQLGSNHLRVSGSDFRFTSRLIDGRFPDYRRVIPSDDGHTVTLDRQRLRDALSRTAILSNEKYRGVRVRLTDNALELQAHNPENEEAEERLELDYDGDALEVGFNVGYLLDALSAISGDLVALHLYDANSSCLLTDVKDERCRYVIMPMRL